MLGQAFAHAGYLGGLSLHSSPRNTTSCSAWRTYADARDFAFSQGSHAVALSRIRPVRSRGTLDGRDPFAGLLRSQI